MENIHNEPAWRGKFQNISKDGSGEAYEFIWDMHVDSCRGYTRGQAYRYEWS